VRKSVLAAATALPFAFAPLIPARFLAAAPAALALPGAASAPPEAKLFSVLGKKVKSAGGADIGRIIDVLADETGPRTAIIEFGGFLGVGAHKITVDWRALRFGEAQKGEVVLPDLIPIS
jgi:hypothetical protein